MANTSQTLNWHTSDDTELLNTLNAFFSKSINQFDSAQISFAQHFKDLIDSDGGDDSFAGHNTDLVVLAMIQHITYEDIEDYDNSNEENDSELYLAIYTRIKNTILNK